MTYDPNCPVPQYQDDAAGIYRKCGLLLPEADVVCMAKSYDATYPNNIMDDADIKKLVTRDRQLRRVTFSDPHWVDEGDQHTYGSCAGWGGASGTSKTRWLNGVRDGIVLSGSYAYSKCNNNQDHGSALDRIMNTIMEGLPSTADCKWDNVWRRNTKQFDDKLIASAGDCYFAETIQAFKSGIALGLIGVLAMQVSGNCVNFRDSTGDAILPVWNGGGNHCYHTDDLVWRNGEFLMDGVNNWSRRWGWNGRAWMRMASIQQTFKVHKHYLIGSITEGKHAIDAARRSRL